MPKSLEYVNSEVFLNYLSVMTNGFTEIPEAQFKKWNALRSIDVTASYEELRTNIQNLNDAAPLPASIHDYFLDGISDLTLEQRFDLYTELRSYDDSLSPLLGFVDPISYKSYKENFEAFESGVGSSNDLEWMMRLSKNVYDEINNFKVAIDSIIPKRDAIIKVFASQNIKYVTGELNLDKVFKLLKSQFGDDWNGYVKYKGVLIEHLLANSGITGISKTSTSFMGLSFEKAILELYRILGYTVSETNATGDFGIDIIAQSNAEKIGIQCKNYAGNVGVDSVMQAHSGGHFYECSRYVVCSTNGFTTAALEMATKLKVELLVYKGSLT